MSKKSNSASSGGLGVCSVVGIVFIILKLVHVIDWPWIWVLSPFWIGIAFWIAVAIVLFVIAFLTSR